MENRNIQQVAFKPAKLQIIYVKNNQSKAKTSVI